MQCFVINLAKDTTRRSQIVGQLNELGIDHEVFPAVNGKELTPEEMLRDYDLARAHRDDRDMSVGEIGCALSHLGVYRRMLESGTAAALVLEDDAKLDRSTAGILTALQPLMGDEKPLVVLLSCVFRTSYFSSTPLVPGYVASSVLEGAWGAHGYVLNRAAAAALLQGLYPVRLRADVWNRFKKERLIELRAVVPYCVGLAEVAKQSNLDSDRAPLVLNDRARRESGLIFLLHRYVYRKFIYQIFVRPFTRKQSITW